MIEFFEFTCNIEYLAEFEKKIQHGSIFIVNIHGIDCRNLIVRFMQIRKTVVLADILKVD